MSKLIDFGQCGKWQKETLIAHCITGEQAKTLARPNDLFDKIGCWKLSVFEPEYAHETFIVPPLYITVKAINMYRKKNTYFRLEKLVLRIPNARIVYDTDCDFVTFSFDYVKLLNYIKGISWSEFEKQHKEK